MILPSEIEDGSGLPGATVYEPPEVALGWLSGQLGGALAAEPDLGKQAATLRWATREGESFLSASFTGSPVVAGQSLLFPADGATDRSGVIASWPPPLKYLELIRLIADLKAGDEYMPLRDLAHLRKTKSFIGSEDEHHDPDSLRTLEANHPDLAAILATLSPAPSLPRQRRH